ncbi:putative ditrans,polycis-polyprenyl diphosphate synthase ((2E,6E)-farnesyl diphosphate specific) [Helianthus annuus]|uniref:Alkyl transferase n=1 Tax=Helianthus annuus TaxID=4232 RepID=A0A251U6R8_HELAN|nr:dehydrodolichyl diphosphate synthase 2 [Helianthus annuus]KAF5795947.1 putative ditrans,polycis-polyprenyl diphosphate synthase ((2E,6E)-farnesyl diphosphate specific) [Helianthus annuus]KAJ0539384.1 putative ditrans,polycis-polyprenyl diphosphate synthase ((2E,6E)-farnesyl diphosphate specific) [Helianthus annuus]KAJ0719684.1 putative ditrans,polycis-polyprenyl diphosphate synthase ((2E,6E)-farnesyl diphosphate specific) [Helianthus annuus]
MCVIMNQMDMINSEKTCVTSADLNGKDNIPDESLPGGLKKKLLPKHIAMIVDGNRRWAVQKGLSAMFGHNAGRMILMPLLRLCSKLEIKVVSFFVFSTENWRRPTEEINFLMKVVEDLLRVDGEELHSHGCRVSVMGDKSKLSETLQKLSTEIEEKSRTNSGTHIIFAINYSGKHDIIKACKNLATQVKDGVILPNQINENIFAQQLYTNYIDFPCPDLVIRTSGEIRISNFMLWQMAYSKLYFTKKYFPDFGENDLIEALRAFQRTQ